MRMSSCSCTTTRLASPTNYAKVIFADTTGYAARRKSATRWFSTNDVQEHSLLPNANNGKLLAWADEMIKQGVW